MISAPPRLSHVLLATALAAFAASGAAAAGNMFLKLHDVAGESRAAAGRGHGEQIEIHSIQWGNAPAAGGRFKGEIAGIEPAFKGSGGSKARGGTTTVDANEKITIHGASTESAGTKGGGKASSDMVMKGSKIGQNSTAGGDTDRPVVIGRLPNPPAEPMQYNPKEYSVSKSNNWGAARRATPLDKGSVWIRVSSPWSACRVGTHYPSLELGGGGRTYVLQDVTVASCGAGASPNEVAFYYNKIAFNAANRMSRPAE